MSAEVIFKKLEQIGNLLDELDKLFDRSFFDFQKDLVIIRAAERNFQLIVEIAVDINTHILIKETKKTPDTYRQSFADLKRLNVLKGDYVGDLEKSARLRNILVHEYDFEEDFQKFFESAKEMLPAYHNYLNQVYGYAKKSK
ncbi:MAG: DUF86 domain-containing protein [Patescibacteria group bacterium]